MANKPKKKNTRKGNKSGAEKPISLHGAPFMDVLRALIKTKPIPKKPKKKNGRELEEYEKSSE